MFRKVCLSAMLGLSLMLSACEGVGSALDQIDALESILRSVIEDGQTVVGLRVMSNDRDNENRDYNVYHPLKVGLVFEGATEYVEDSIIIGLVETHATEGVTEGELGRLPISTCMLGGFEAVFEDYDAGDFGSVQYFEQEFIIPDDCLLNQDGTYAEEKTYNLWVGVNAKQVTDITEADTVDQGDYNTFFYNKWHKEQKPEDVDTCFLLTGNNFIENETLTTYPFLEGGKGCVVDITVRTSPGADVNVESSSFLSEVAVLPFEVDSEVTGDTTGQDLLPVDSEVGERLGDLQLDVQLQGIGVAYKPQEGESAPNALDQISFNNGAVGPTINVKACPAELDSDGEPTGGCQSGTTAVQVPIQLGSTGGNSSTEQHALSITSQTSATAETVPDYTQTDTIQDKPVVAYNYPVTFMQTGAPNLINLPLLLIRQVDGSLAQDEFYLRMYGDGAADEDWTDTTLLLVNSCMVPNFDEAGNVDTDANNCTEQYLAVRQEIRPASASYLSYYWRRGASTSGDVVRAGYELKTDNALNLSGAYSNSLARVYVGGWLSTDVLKLWTDVGAYVSLVGTGYSTGISLFNFTLWHNTRQIRDYRRDFTPYAFTKDLCARYNYGVAGVGLNASLCASGRAGIDVSIGVVAKYGSGYWPFANSTRIGHAFANFVPSATFGINANAWLDVAVARGGITGYINLVNLSLPVTGYLQWGLVNGPKLVTREEVRADLSFNFLSGGIEVWVDLLKPAWCGCGSWCPGYPCSQWRRVASYHLVRWAGYTWRYNIFRLGPYVQTLF